LVSVGFASREFLSWSLISRQVKSSVYVGEKVSDFTQPIRSAAANVDQFLVSSSRVRCSVARQLVNLSAGVWPKAIEAAPRQLAVTSQLGTPSATAARVRRAEASVGQNEMPSAEAAAMAIINRRNMTISRMACNLSYKHFKFLLLHRTAAAQREQNAISVDLNQNQSNKS
jgi:hypothetical protein